MTTHYAFWNNKGGTGKTSLVFQAVCMYAESHPTEKILSVDVCPQANFSELLLGGLLGDGSENLSSLQSQNPRKTVGGYFQERLPSPYAKPATFRASNYICTPNDFNPQVPENIDLLAGDAIVELQSNAIATLANTQIPGTNTWLEIIDWLRDFMDDLQDEYEVVFVDANPSFSLYTQIALSCVDRMVLPVMADDSSRRAIQNAFALVHGVNLPSPIYSQYSFSAKLTEAERSLPQIHLIIKNRLTQYMGPASAYQSVLTSIDNLLIELIRARPDIFSFDNLPDGIVDVRDFQTTGVVAFAKGYPFTKLQSGSAEMPGRNVSIRSDYLNNCIEAMQGVVSKL